MTAIDHIDGSIVRYNFVTFLIDIEVNYALMESK